MTEKEVIVYLDFNNRLTKDVFENGREAFIRIANLHKKNPLAQVNDTVFQGTYDYAMGTNLFFEPLPDTQLQTDPFTKRGPVQYENSFNDTKTITFKTMRVPPRKVELPQNVSKIDFYLDWDYSTLLQKISEGSIKLQDILRKENSNEQNKEIDVEIDTMEVEYQPEHSIEDVKKSEKHVEDEPILDQMVSTQILDSYQKLQELAFRPVRSQAVLDRIGNCDPVYKDVYEYNNLEKQILQPCGLFATETVVDINEETLENCVDIDRCILYGIIEKSSSKPRILTKEQKHKVLTLDNFDNLSLAARYYVLRTHVEDLERYLATKSSDELNTCDKYGRKPSQTLETYKRLTEAVKKRVEEIKFSSKKTNVL